MDYKKWQEENCIGCEFALAEKAGTGAPCCTYPGKLIPDKNGNCSCRKPPKTEEAPVVPDGIVEKGQTGQEVATAVAEKPANTPPAVDKVAQNPPVEKPGQEQPATTAGQAPGTTSTPAKEEKKVANGAKVLRRVCYQTHDASKIEVYLESKREGSDKVRKYYSKTYPNMGQAQTYMDELIKKYKTEPAVQVTA